MAHSPEQLEAIAQAMILYISRTGLSEGLSSVFFHGSADDPEMMLCYHDGCRKTVCWSEVKADGKVGL